MNGFHPVAGENVTAVFLDEIPQGFGKKDRAAGKTAGPVDVQDGDERVDIGRR